MAGVSPPQVALLRVGTATGRLRGVDLIFAGKGGVSPTFCRYSQCTRSSGPVWERGTAGNRLAVPWSSNIVPCPRRCKPTAPGDSSSRPGSVSSLLGTCLPDPGASKSLPALLLAARLQPRLPFTGISGTSQPGVPKQLHPSPFPEYKCHRGGSHCVPGEDGGDRAGPPSPLPDEAPGGTASPWLAAVPF